LHNISNVKILGFDGSINGWRLLRLFVFKPIKHSRIRIRQFIYLLKWVALFTGKSSHKFYRKWISENYGLEEIFEKIPKQSRSVILKCDIEGSEYLILDSIIKHKDLFSCVCLEFHDVESNAEAITSFLTDLDFYELDKTINPHDSNCEEYSLIAKNLSANVKITSQNSLIYERNNIIRNGKG
jgi:hypothetical protein